MERDIKESNAGIWSVAMAILVCCTVAAAPSEARRAECAKRAAELVAKLTAEERIGQLMMDSPEVPRLGIPKYHWWNEALHGAARAGLATVFPQSMGLAAPSDAADRRLHHLEGFARVRLAPGEEKSVTMTVKRDQFAVYGEDGRASVPAGKSLVFVGGVQPGFAACLSSEIGWIDRTKDVDR